MKFDARIAAADGSTHDEVIEGADQMAIYNEVKDRGETLISAHEVSTKARRFTINISLFGRVKFKDKIVFIKNLGSMLDAGLAMSRALAVIEKQTKQKKFKAIIQSLNKSISQGKTLSDGMKEYPGVFTPLIISMVKAGEESGSLSQSLRTVSSQMESSYQLTRKIRGAMMYPMIVLLAMMGVAVFMLVFVIPTLSQTFKELNVELPLSTQIIIGTSDFLKSHYILALAFVIVVVVAVYMGLRTKRGKRMVDYTLLKLPVIGSLVQEINSARTARTFSSLISAGVDILVATKITSDVLQNSYYKEVMVTVEEKIQKGEPIAKVFSEREKLYPPFVGEMISVGEETGQLAQMLLGVAVFYENDVEQKTKDLSSIVEPVLMIFIGLAVGLFAISIISPIYSVGDSI